MKSKKPLLIILVVLALVAGGAFAYTQFWGDDNEDPTLSDPTINYGPPTEEEKQVADDKKQEIVQEDEEEQNPQPAPTAAKVVITDASQYGSDIEVRAYISNVYETGTCTATFTKGSQSFERQTPATKEASNTQCKSFIVPRSAFSSAGTWTVTVSYQSTKARGEAKETIQVQ